MITLGGKYVRMVPLGAVGLMIALTTLVIVQPRWLIDSFAARAPDVLYYAKTKDRVVALTIDDGPDSRTTERILNVLAEQDARATFFLIGNRIEGREELVRRIVRSGHELGNHLERDEPSVLLSAAEFEARLLEADRILSRYMQPRWLRPGSGWYNRSLLEVAGKHDYRVVLGSIYPYDAQIPLSRFAAWHIRRKLHPGAIIILHDGGGRGLRTAATLRSVLPEIRRRGYRIVTLSQLVRSTELGDSDPAGPP